MLSIVLCFQAEYGIRDLVRTRGLGDVYKRQRLTNAAKDKDMRLAAAAISALSVSFREIRIVGMLCILWGHFVLEPYHFWAYGQ